MTFTSGAFLLFLPIFITAYFFLPARARIPFLLVASLIFYAWANPLYLLILLASTLIDYLAGINMSQLPSRAQRRPFLVTSLIFNLGILFVFKYFDFTSSTIAYLLTYFGLEGHSRLLNLVLPVGISFYTFQTMGYSIEVYQGTVQPEHNLLKFSLFVAFFPKLISGPLDRAANLIPQFDALEPLFPERIVSGIQRVLWGFFKKLVIADRLAPLVAVFFDHPDRYEGIPLLVASYLFAYQLYCDFSGYMDIALGSAKILGFNLPENFDRPYASHSIGEFWRRWHITLSTWFRLFLFSPLTRTLLEKYGRDRRGRVQVTANLVTMGLIGLWHGSNWTFIVWGLLHGVYLSIEAVSSGVRKKLADHLPEWPVRLFSLAVTFHFVVFSWVFFRANSLSDAITILHQMSKVRELSLGMSHFELLLALALIAMMEMVQFFQSRHWLWERVLSAPAWIHWMAWLGLIMAILFFSPFGGEAFLYFQF